MGNICCGYDEEGYKQSAWYADADAENGNRVSFNDDDDDYNAKATDREQLLLLHDSAKSTRRLLSNMSENGGHVQVDDGDGVANGRRNRRNRMTRLKRPSITATPILDVTAAYEPPSYPKSEDTTKFLLSAMGDNFVFDSMDDSSKLQFANAMQFQEYNEGDWIMKQGDVGDYFYIVGEGEVAFHVSPSASLNDSDPLPPQVGTGSAGSNFGELALLYNTPRAASVRAVSSTSSFKIDQTTFRSLLLSRQLQDRSNIMDMVQDLSVFEDLDDNKVQKLVDAFVIVDFCQGERIVNKGDNGDVLYIVKSGQVKVDDIGHGSSKFEDQLLREGDCFGERALITGETRAANVTAAAPSTLLAISKVKLEEILGPLKQAVLHSSQAKYLRSIPLFEYLEPDEIDRCVQYLKEEGHAKGEKICAKGKLYLIQEGHALMMLQKKSGEVDASSDGQGENGSESKAKKTIGPKLIKLTKGDYFGDVWGGYKDTAQDHVADFMDGNTATVEEDMKCLTLDVTDIERVIGNLERVSKIDLVETLEQQKNSKPKKRSRMTILKNMKEQRSSFDFVKERRSTTNRDVLNLGKLKKHRILGMGSFGKVWLVTPKSNEEDKTTPYALKMVSKRQILQQQLSSTVLREKNVMESIQHPFLLRMVSAFQDENYLYFVMDLILGGELFELLYADGGRKEGDNPAWKESVFYKSFGAQGEKKTKGLMGVGVRKGMFYGAGVIDAFAYLHNRRIVYRDLKPENIMLNSHGYCVVVDMGFAKVVTDKTYTMCGTLEYIAPEVIVNKGHNHTADYWSFGCLLYELVVGQTPFFDARLDQLSLLKNIVKANFTFPQAIYKLNPDSRNGLEKAICNWKDIISRLLKPKSVERLGNLINGVDDILRHEWFAKIDFNEFRSQKIPAPWVPTIVDPMDTSHFDNKFGGQDQPECFRRKLTDTDQAVFSSF